MKVWLTEIQAINPATGRLSTWAGPNIQASTKEKAEAYCQNNGLGYCKIIGVLLEEIEIIEPIKINYSLN